jgi:hypothetical protein
VFSFFENKGIDLGIKMKLQIEIVLRFVGVTFKYSWGVVSGAV